MVRRHIDQMIRTRNYKARNERIETYWSRVTKGRKSGLRGEWENAISGKQLDSVQGETLAVSATRARGADPGWRKKTIESFWSQRRESFWKERPENRAKKSSKELVQIRRAIIGILPYVKITNLYRNANSATNVCSDTLMLMARPVESRRKVV